MAFILFLDVVAIYDMLQRKHSILRNFPVIGHLRYLGETIRPEMQQYFIERNFDGAPFDRDTRTVVYERAKGLSSKKSFGTERKINAPGYEYVRLLKYGADLYWQLGSGYFGARTEDGDFDPIGKGVMSPPYHRVYSTPRGLVRFMGTTRELNGGKPVGFKLCVGSKLEFLAVCKAMLEENITPDFIIVDSAEGGTGAAPLEYSDRVGLPLTDGLILVHNALLGAGLRNRIKLGASGKVITGFDIVKRMYIGADFVNSARGMMMATGCIQSQLCHTNTCAVGEATQDSSLWRALDVDDKGQRVANYHNATVAEAASLLASLGLNSFSELGPCHLLRRTNEQVGETSAELYNWLQPGELLSGTRFHNWAEAWETADPDTFHYPAVHMRG